MTRTAIACILLLTLSVPALAQKCVHGPFCARDGTRYATVDEGKNGCGPGALARTLWKFVQENGLKMPEAWGADAQSIYAWLLTQPGWTEQGGMTAAGMEKAVQAASAALGAANGGRVSLQVETLPVQGKGRGPDSGVDMNETCKRVQAALGQPNTVVICHANYWNLGWAPIGHIFVVTELSGLREEDEFAENCCSEPKSVVVKGVDDGETNDGSGNDAQEKGPFDAHGVEEGSSPEEGQQVVVAFTIIRIVVKK